MATWLNYTEHYHHTAHTVTGTVLVQPSVWSQQLGNHRDLLVYLPPSYGTSDRRYPVIYMHDGQNLFDSATAFAGEWRVDETLQVLSAEGIEAIVVGIPNGGKERANEYLPCYDRRFKAGGRAGKYMAFLIESVKPLVDADFRTLPGREHTGLAGSSFGGYVSLFGLLRYPEIFGFAGVFSPAFWPAEKQFRRWVQEWQGRPGRIYMDVGTRETAYHWLDRYFFHLLSRRYVASVQRMVSLLRAKGFTDLYYTEEPGGVHNEAAWARRLPDALRFLLKA